MLYAEIPSRKIQVHLHQLMMLNFWPQVEEVRNVLWTRKGVRATVVTAWSVLLFIVLIASSGCGCFCLLIICFTASTHLHLHSSVVIHQRALILFIQTLVLYKSFTYLLTYLCRPDILISNICCDSCRTYVGCGH